jgi:hypothetical protein
MALIKVKQKRGPGKPIQKGQVLNPLGRPKGSKSKLGEDFIQAVYERFQARGVDAINDMIDIDPGGFVKVCAGLVPKDISVNLTGAEQFVQAWKAISEKAA